MFVVVTCSNFVVLFYLRPWPAVRLVVLFKSSNFEEPIHSLPLWTQWIQTCVSYGPIIGPIRAYHEAMRFSMAFLYDMQKMSSLFVLFAIQISIKTWHLRYLGQFILMVYQKFLVINGTGYFGWIAVTWIVEHCPYRHCCHHLDSAMAVHCCWIGFTVSYYHHNCCPAAWLPDISIHLLLKYTTMAIWSIMGQNGLGLIHGHKHWWQPLHHLFGTVGTNSDAWSTNSHG